MSTHWEKVGQDVIEMAQELIEKYHPSLQFARIGFLFRDPAPKSNGRIVLGKASKVTPSIMPLLQEELDFIIWFSLDVWQEQLDSRQRLALIDHELSHCFMENNEKPTLKGHDIEEFNAVIQRHGLWLPDLEDTAKAVQGALFNRQGKVVAIETGELLDLD